MTTWNSRCLSKRPKRCNGVNRASRPRIRFPPNIKPIRRCNTCSLLAKRSTMMPVLVMSLILSSSSNVSPLIADETCTLYCWHSQLRELYERRETFLRSSDLLRIFFFSRSSLNFLPYLVSSFTALPSMTKVEKSSLVLHTASLSMAFNLFRQYFCFSKNWLFEPNTNMKLRRYSTHHKRHRRT